MLLLCAKHMVSKGARRTPFQAVRFQTETVADKLHKRALGYDFSARLPVARGNP
jgi:hypothetical protein